MTLITLYALDGCEVMGANMLEMESQFTWEHTWTGAFSTYAACVSESNNMLKVHCATFLQVCKQKTELLMQEIVVWLLDVLYLLYKLYVYICIC